MTTELFPGDEPVPAKPSGYEQGYRDGLLTARSALIGTMMIDVAILALNDLIDSKTQDLWSTMALVQVLTPEAHALRMQLRAPFGAAIDSEGRMLFLRVPNPPHAPLDYDTGVMALLEKVALLEQEINAPLESEFDPG